MSAPAPQQERAGNAAPVVESVTLNPGTPLPGTAVDANVEVQDPEGDPYRVSFEWKVNGEVTSSGSHPRLRTNDLRKGDRIEVTVVASDGRRESDPVRRSTRVGNRPPLLQGVLLEPQGTVRPSDELFASPEAIDPDEDPLEFDYAWLVNGREIGQRGRTLSAKDLKRGDKVRVRVIARDGDDSSRAAESREVTIGNSAPLIKQIPEAESDEGLFRYAFEAEDADGDRNLRFRLRKAPEGMQIDPITGVATWRPKASQAGVHPVEVMVVDSHGDGSALSFNVTVTATPGDAGEQPPAATP
jgi:hypothetical protein